MDKIGLFEFTTNFCVDKTDLRSHPRFDESYPRFMVNKVLSMSPKTVHLAMFMSQFGSDIPKGMHFLFFNSELDRDRIYFNYAKKKNEVPIKKLRYIQEYFQCSEERALEYIDLLSEKQFDTIIDLYIERDRYDKKKIKMKKG